MAVLIGELRLRRDDEILHAQASEPALVPGGPEGEAAADIVVAIAVGAGGSVDPRWGRAQRVAVATFHRGRLSNWEETEVGWGTLREEGSERAHHARVARFVKQHGVQIVVAHHMGADMLAMLGRMGLEVQTPASADAREAVLAAVGLRQGEGVAGPGSVAGPGAVEGPGLPGSEVPGRPLT
jgi:predicted Fe-Mo cluster-binding NifX family protein